MAQYGRMTMFLTDIFNKKTAMPDAASALPGRPEPIATSTEHFVNGNPLHGPYPEGMARVLFGMGCFWGAERHFWKIPGVWVTAAGYSGGVTPNPTYQETVTGLTGHAEVVLTVYDPSVVSFKDLLKSFFEAHDPTQGMRQGNDVGTTYRSAIYVYNDDGLQVAKAARDVFQKALDARGWSEKITTEIARAKDFYFAEDYHQQYLAKNPGGYCGLRGTGVNCSLN
jgi:peptide-methionine (S)-S-oxide reductase